MHVTGGLVPDNIQLPATFKCNDCETVFEITDNLPAVVRCPNCTFRGLTVLSSGGGAAASDYKGYIYITGQADSRADVHELLADAAFALGNYSDIDGWD